MVLPGAPANIATLQVPHSHSRYSMPAMHLRARYAMSGTELAYCGTDQAHGTQCAVLSQDIVVPGIAQRSNHPGGKLTRPLLEGAGPLPPYATPRTDI
eukprot:2016384-Rhodomonas_salina.2